jgi:dTDP-4-amino-4,6-dideoxygalactose transaminase
MSAPPITIPVANPGAGYRALQPQIDAAVARVLASGWYVLGQEGRAFEAEFAEWLGPGMHAVGCANGTDALALALRGLGIGPGDTVATVSHTAVATVAAIEMAGAVPLLLDVEPQGCTMDPAELAQVLQSPPPGMAPVRAVILVHLYGQPADLAAIAAACDRHRVALIEDCSQAHGARYAGRHVGTFGAASAFSCYPTKNLGALGDGGVVATADPALAERLAGLRQYGWRQQYVSDEAGVNSRLDELQAAILRVKLAQLDGQNARRRAIAAAYDAALAGGPVAAPWRRPDTESVFHLYVVQAAARDALRARLAAAGIGTALHYPVPVHAQPAYRGRVRLGPAGCRQTAMLAERILSLPMFPELDAPAVAAVAEALRRAQ